MLRPRLGGRLASGWSMLAGLLRSVPFAWVRTPREPLASALLTSTFMRSRLPVSMVFSGRERSCRSAPLVMAWEGSSSSLPL